MPGVFGSSEEHDLHVWPRHVSAVWRPHERVPDLPQGHRAPNPPLLERRFSAVLINTFPGSARLSVSHAKLRVTSVTTSILVLSLNVLILLKEEETRLHLAVFFIQVPTLFSFQQHLHELTLSACANNSYFITSVYYAYISRCKNSRIYSIRVEHGEV